MNNIFKEFPKNEQEIINLAKDESLILVKCSKGADLDFNPQGLFFGNFWTLDGIFRLSLKNIF